MAASVSREPTADFTPEGAEIQEEARRQAYAGEPPAADRPRRNHVVARSLKDSFLAAIVTFALAAPTIGLQTMAVGASSNLRPRAALGRRWRSSSASSSSAGCCSTCSSGRRSARSSRASAPTWPPPCPAIPNVGAGRGRAVPVRRGRHPDLHAFLFPAAEPLHPRPRHADPDLCDARLGPQHRGRAGRPARPRLCRLLRGRRLCLRAAGRTFRLVVLDLPAAGRHPRRLLGHDPRLPGAAGCAATISPS